jgi:hypothetical protein
MNKYLKVLLATVLAITLAGVLAACGPNLDEPPTDHTKIYMEGVGDACVAVTGGDCDALELTGWVWIVPRYDESEISGWREWYMSGVSFACYTLYAASCDPKDFRSNVGFGKNHESN